MYKLSNFFFAYCTNTCVAPAQTIHVKLALACVFSRVLLYPTCNCLTPSPKPALARTYHLTLTTETHHTPHRTGSLKKEKKKTPHRRTRTQATPARISPRESPSPAGPVPPPRAGCCSRAPAPAPPSPAGPTPPPLAAPPTPQLLRACSAAPAPPPSTAGLAPPPSAAAPGSQLLRAPAPASRLLQRRTPPRSHGAPPRSHGAPLPPILSTPVRRPP